MEFIIAIFHFHGGNDIDHVIFGKNPTENRVNEDIRIFPAGGLTKGKGVHEKYLKVNIKNINDFNLELLTDFLFYKLSSMDDADSLKIGNQKVLIKKEEIKKALSIHLNEI